MEEGYYDSTQIENWGIDAVGAIINQTDTLRRYFKENDKTPLWDGNVIIYKSRNKSKKNILGYVNVQLKGKLDTEEELKKENISYIVEINDLIKYKENSGTIYFVTLINKHDTHQQTIFYDTLTSRKIRGYIKGKEQQETCTINLKRLPHSKYEIQTIFYNFFNEAKLGDIEPISLDNIPSLLKENVDISACITQYISEDGMKSSPIDRILNSELFWTAKFPNHPIPIPIDFGSGTILSIIYKDDLPSILVNGEKYDKYYSIDRNKNRTMYKFGKSTTLEIPTSLKGINIKFSPADLLSDRIKDFNFFINLIETSEIKFEGKEPLILGEIKSDKSFEIEEAKEELDFYKSVDEFWKTMKVYDNFDIGNINSNSSLKELQILMNSINGKKKIHISSTGLENVHLLKKDISNFKILLFIEGVEQEKCFYKIYNYFDYKANYKITRNDDEHITSKYSVLNVDDFIELSNIDFSNILPSYKELLPFNNKIYNPANYDLLNLLLAYDKRNELTFILDAAKDLASWILEKGCDVVPYDISVINYLQIIKRQRKLSVDEIKILYDISEKSDILTHKIGANILLENYKVAQIQFDQLEEEDRNSFKLFPIYFFWKES